MRAAQRTTDIPCNRITALIGIPRVIFCIRMPHALVGKLDDNTDTPSCYNVLETFLTCEVRDHLLKAFRWGKVADPVAERRTLLMRCHQCKSPIGLRINRKEGMSLPCAGVHPDLGLFGCPRLLVRCLTHFASPIISLVTDILFYFKPMNGFSTARTSRAPII